MADYEVIICGLGPVGQLLALLLGDRGVRTLAIDARAEPYPLPRAAVIDDEVLRIFQSVRLDQEILAASQVQPRASIVTAGGRPVQVLEAGVGRLGHPPLVSINQPTIERTMLDALASRPTVELRWNTALEVVDRRADHVDVYLRPTAGGPTERLRAAWLVGCDGGPSTVRTQLGISFHGRTAPQRWIVADALVDRPLRKVPHPHFVGNVDRPEVTLPMSPGRHRWEWMLHPGEDPAPLLEPAALERLIARWLTDDEHAELERAVVYTFHTRMAERWRRGRVLLAGDAAHLTPPFAGQGFSSGARDAANLSWKLADVLAGAPERLLDTYEQERRPHVAAMQRTANLMGAYVQPTDRRIAMVRDAVLRTVDGTPAHRWFVSNVKPLPTYGNGAFASRPSRLPWLRTTGTLFPQSDRLDDRLPNTWVGIALTDGTASALTEAGLAIADPGTDAAWLAARRLDFAILRPDRFVFACGTARDLPAALAAWRAASPPVGATHQLRLVTEAAA